MKDHETEKRSKEMRRETEKKCEGRTERLR
jgi:hypothetical protein